MRQQKSTPNGEICLGELLKIQSDFQEVYCPMKDIDISSLASAIASEAMEIWSATGKWWYRKKKIDEEKLREQSIDIFHFLLALWLKLGMDEQDVTDYYKSKMKVNVERQKEDMSQT